MELKTLKHLTKINNLSTLPQDNPILEVDRYIEYDELRQEAIKWIKEIELEGNGEKEWNFLPPYFDKRSHESIVLWIKMFFNITEEDLK